MVATRPSDRASGIADGLASVVEWATSVSLPPRPVLARGARVLADHLAVTVGARAEPEVASFHARLLSRSREAESTLWRGASPRTDRMSAAVGNALAANWLELDEGYRPVACHAGLYVLPALLAEAEATSLSCADTLRALALAYEVVTRVARAWVQPTLSMQAHGRYGAVGAAAGLALCRRLEPAAAAQVLGAAATCIGPAPRDHLSQGVLVRNAWAASAAWHGFMVLEWADCGIHGSVEAFHAVYGEVHGGQPRAGAWTEALGADWAVMQGYTKPYACCQHLHAAVAATLDLAARQSSDLEHVAGVDVHCHPGAFDFADPAPVTSLGAKFSLPHAVAVALAYGDGGASAFGAASLQDPRITALRARVRMLPWTGHLEPPHDRPARVVVTMRDGATAEAECLSAPGAPDNPLPEDAWRDKLQDLAAAAYPRLTQAMQDLVDLKPQMLARSWTSVVREIRGD